MSFQVGIGSLAGTVFFRWEFVPLCKLWNQGGGGSDVNQGNEGDGLKIFLCASRDGKTFLRSSESC